MRQPDRLRNCCELRVVFTLIKIGLPMEGRAGDKRRYVPFNRSLAMDEINLQLTGDERAFLINSLETMLKEVRVEAHRTHFSPAFRDQVLREESTVRSLLEKLRTS